MAIEFSCSHCQSVLRTLDDTGGKVARCPSCGKLEAIPELHPEAFAPHGLSENSQYPAAKPAPHRVEVRQDSPYAAPQFGGQRAHGIATRESARIKLLPPVITLLVLNGSGTLFLMLAMTGGIMSLLENGNNSDDLGTLIGCGLWGLLHLCVVYEEVPAGNDRNHLLARCRNSVLFCFNRFWSLGTRPAPGFRRETIFQ